MDNLSGNINETIKYINDLEDFFDGKLGDVQKKAYSDNIPAIPKETARLLSVILSVNVPKMFWKSARRPVFRPDL